MVRRVVGVGDVRPAGLVGVDAEVVEELAAAGAGDPALADVASCTEVIRTGAPQPLVVADGFCASSAYHVMFGPVASGVA